MGADAKCHVPVMKSRRNTITIMIQLHHSLVTTIGFRSKIDYSNSLALAPDLRNAQSSKQITGYIMIISHVHNNFNLCNEHVNYSTYVCDHRYIPSSGNLSLSFTFILWTNERQDVRFVL